METLLQVSVSYGSWKGFTLSDAKDSTRLALVDGNNVDERDEERSDGSMELLTKPDEEEVCDLQDLQGADRCKISSLQANLRKKHNVNELDSVVEGQSIMEDVMPPIPRVVDFSSQLAEAKVDCASYTLQYEEKVILSEKKALQYTMIQQKSAEALGLASDAIISLATSLKKSCQKATMVLKERHE